MKKIIVFLFVSVFLISLISAAGGVGIKYSQQSAKIPEGAKTCMTYSVYNPWEDDTYVKIKVSEGLQEILTLQETEAVKIPAHTSSSEAIPVEFCFEVPKVYDREYQMEGVPILGRAISKLDCPSDTFTYSGEVLVQSVASPFSVSGSGGSATQMVVGAPLNVRVECMAYNWDYTFVYIVVAFLSAGVVGLILFRRYRKPKAQRIKEKMKKLRAEMKKK